MAVVAVLGTTISPYLFFWQASQEVEEVKCNRGEKALKRAPARGERPVESNPHRYLRRHGIFKCGRLLYHPDRGLDIAHPRNHRRGDMRAGGVALEPIAGRFATALFVCGIVGTGMLAVPVLASAAYGIGEGCRWCVSLERRPHEAVGFYSVMELPSPPGWRSIFYTSIR